ncbi:hypothetical protein LSUE1_G007793 [Lachnellula suecica]|uniref:Heterokaryon incompatibility domain-containing protein n=1 Tax=Lachnellula suecica TaxID=602035 RepID=A0A8T9BXJ7_9HELO|nr:hypothetical protein LSUE1_G007793 [Lachnellula suecica]
MTTGERSKEAESPHGVPENVPCDQCKCFTVDYKFHVGGPIPLDNRMANRLSYTNEDRYFFKLPWVRKDVWPAFPGLATSFSSGCALCGILREKLSAEEWLRPEPLSPTAEITIKAEFGFQESAHRKPTGAVFECQFAGESQWHRTARQPSFVLAASGDSSASRQFRGLRASDPLSLNNQATIKSWMNECRETHKYCKRQTTQSLPSRLIEVEPQNPKLVPTKGKTGVYATLSYCWGLSPENPFELMYTTTLSTLSARMGGMLMNEMPRTLQDAVLATRALGLKYLWVDALCIIQDSKPDVEHEIKNMASVYGNCELVICATSAVSSKDGFLRPRPALRPLVLMSFMPSEGGDAGTYGFYDPKTFPKRNNWGVIESSGWNKRAWTFQERVISPRVLHFSSDMVYMECRTSDFSELGCTPRERVIGGYFLGANFRYLGISEYFSSVTPRDAAKAHAIYAVYYQVASEYSKRQLSFEADREAAFSAVVEQFTHILPRSESMYGLWMDDLWRGLVWNVNCRRGDNPVTASQDTKPVSSWPSWSWYSCRDVVSWSDSIKPWNPQSTQNLRLPGKNSPSLISTSEEFPSKLNLSAVLRTVEIKIGPGENMEIAVDGERWGGANLDAKLDIADDDARSNEISMRTIHILQLRDKSQIYDEAGAITMSSVAGLILEPADSPGSYRRIGTFSIYSRQKWEALFEDHDRTQITLI